MTAVASPSSWNRRLKRWPGWVLLLFVVVGALAVGATRDTGPRTAGDRIDDISRRLACPECQGESVYESRSNASESIRNEIRARVADSEMSDDEIIEYVADRFGGQVLLVPRSSGLDALVWALPAVAAVCAVAGLAIAFRRWRVAAGDAHTPTPEDRALVAAALADGDADAADAASPPTNGDSAHA